MARLGKGKRGGEPRCKGYKGVKSIRVLGHLRTEEKEEKVITTEIWSRIKIRGRKTREEV